MFVVIGRFTHTSYGPFATDREASRFVRRVLGSSPRYYEVVRLLAPHSACMPRI